MPPPKLYNRRLLGVLITLACFHSIGLARELDRERTTDQEDLAFDVARLGLIDDRQTAQRADPVTKTTQEGHKKILGEENEDEAAKMQRYKEMLEQRKRERRFRGERVDWRDAGKLADEKLNSKNDEKQTEGGGNGVLHQQLVVEPDRQTAQRADPVTKTTHESHKKILGEENEDEAAKMQRYKEMLEQRKRERRFRGERVDWRDAGKLTDGELNSKNDEKQTEGGGDGVLHQQDIITKNPDQSEPKHAVEKKSTSVPVVAVIGMTVTMAVAAGVGALPFFFVRTFSPRWSAVATAVACGVMFAASFDLIHEGQPYGGRLVVGGILLGAWFIGMMQRWLASMEDVSFGHLHGTRARRLLLMVGIMAAHAMGEGCGVGVSFCGDRGWEQGVLTTLAIGVHNVPEGLAKATVLVSQGASAHEALFWSILTCLPQPLLAIPSFLFVDTFRALLPIALGFAAGCMIWLVFAELLPDALKHISGSEVATSATLAAAALEGIRMAFETMQEWGREDEGAGGSGSTSKVRGPTWMLLPSLLPGVFFAAITCWAAARRSFVAVEHSRLGSRYANEHGAAVAGSMTGLASVLALVLASRSGLRLLGLLRLSPGGPASPSHLLAGLVSGIIIVLVLRRLTIASLLSAGKVAGALVANAGNGYANGSGHIDSLDNGGVGGGDEKGKATSTTDGVVIDRKNPLKHRSGTEALPMFAQDVGPPPKTYAASLSSLAGSGGKTASLSLRAASIVLMIAVGLESFGCSGRWVGIKSIYQMDQGPSVPGSISSSFSLPLCLSFMAATIPRAAILGVCSRSAFGRSFKSWMALVLSVVVTTASGMAVEDSWASRQPISDLDSGAVTFSMPLNISATATSTAIATGAIGVAALLHVWSAIGNASQARYVRFGMVVGVLWVVGILFIAGLGCYGGGMVAVCSLFD